MSARQQEQRQSQQLRQQREPQRKGEKGGQPHLRKQRKAHAGGAAGQAVLLRKKQRGVPETREQKQGKVEQRNSIAYEFHLDCLRFKNTENAHRC